MKTTIDLPDELIAAAMRVSNSKTKIEAIKLGLEELINKERRLSLLQFKGKVDLDINLDTLRDRTLPL